MSATASFGALKNVLTNGGVGDYTKGRLYAALVLSILLYRSEVLCLLEDLFNRSRRPQSGCVCVMCRVLYGGIRYTTKYRIANVSHLKRPSLQTADLYSSPPPCSIGRPCAGHAHESNSPPPTGGLGLPLLACQLSSEDIGPGS